MPNIRNFKFFLIFCGVFTTPLWAGLGDFTFEKQMLSQHLLNRGHYQVRESENGRAHIREFATNAGQIFAITWKGPSTPDLMPLLGRYFPDFSKALEQTKHLPRRVRRPYQLVQGDKVVLERWGHQGALRGRGYVLELFPAGVTLNDIR